MNVSPTSYFRLPPVSSIGSNIVPVRFSFTVTVLFFTSEPIPPNKSKDFSSAARTSGPYERHPTIATLLSDRRAPAVCKAVVASAPKSRLLPAANAHGAPAARANVFCKKVRRSRHLVFIGYDLFTLRRTAPHFNIKNGVRLRPSGQRNPSESGRGQPHSMT